MDFPFAQHGPSWTESVWLADIQYNPVLISLTTTINSAYWPLLVLRENSLIYTTQAIYVSLATSQLWHHVSNCILMITRNYFSTLPIYMGPLGIQSLLSMPQLFIFSYDLPLLRHPTASHISMEQFPNMSLGPYCTRSSVYWFSQYMTEPILLPTTGTNKHNNFL